MLRSVPLAIALALAAGACSKESPSAGPTTKEPAHEDHTAPHGGSILELGEEEAHVEVVHDPKAGVLTLYVFGKDLHSPVAVAAPKILLAGKELAPSPLDAGPGGTATSWRLSDPALAVDPLDGRLRITIGGTTHQTPLEPAGHGH
jgi:hypothetical protein